MEREEKIQEYQAVDAENKKLKQELESSKLIILEGKAGLERVKELQEQVTNYENRVCHLD